MANEIRNYIIGIIVFTAFIVGFIAIIGEFRQSDPSFGSSDQFADFNESFDVYDDVTAETEVLKERITRTNSTGFWGNLGVIDSLIASSWYTMTLMFSSFEFFEDVISSTTMFGVPLWIPTLVISAITIMLVFAIFAYIFRR